MAGTPRISRVDQHQVEIARQPTVLETVVENQNLRAVAIAGDVSRLNPIGSLQMGNARTQLIEDEFFVVRRSRVRAITATENGRTDSVRGKPLDDSGHDWSLAGPSGSQVADAHDRNWSVTSANHTDVEGPVSSANGRSIKERRDG